MKLKFMYTLVVALMLTVAGYAQDQVSKVKLVQTPGKFEGKEMKLKPGKYQFEVSNKGIDHEVAFFLQKESDKDNKDFGTAIANSGVSKMVKDGETASTGVVELTKGRYVYSCPLNPTPHYTIVVE
jgi:Copper binding proteins, plastocyanin/azurin family